MRLMLKILAVLPTIDFVTLKMDLKFEFVKIMYNCSYLV